jgi:hypothetical protein
MIVFKKGEEAELLKSLEDIHHSQGRFYGTYFSQKKDITPVVAELSGVKFKMGSYLSKTQLAECYLKLNEHSITYRR